LPHINTTTETEDVRELSGGTNGPKREAVTCIMTSTDKPHKMISINNETAEISLRYEIITAVNIKIMVKGCNPV
jgi:hypothetical protein